MDGAKILRETWTDDEEHTLVPLYDNEDSVCGIVYNNTPYYFQKNLQGDVIGITDEDSTVVACYTYDAWGKVVDISGCDACIAQINPFRYRGYYYDQCLELYYLQSRYYDPEVGRFVNGDDTAYLGENNTVQSYSLFCYCENEPLCYYDPYGFYVMYIYGKDQEKAAKTNCKRLRKKFLVYQYLVTKEKDFTKVWNERGTNSRGSLSKIDIVIINLHGNCMDIDCVNFRDLKRRKIDTLLLLSCNAGHQDYFYTNPAYKFFYNNDVRQMVCCDGTHFRSERFIGRVVHTVKGDKHFKNFAKSTRKSRGFVLYRRESDGRRISIPSIGNKFASIDKLLKRIGKW